MANADEAGFLQDKLDLSFFVSREGGNTNWRGVDGKSMTMPEGKKKKEHGGDEQRLKGSKYAIGGDSLHVSSHMDDYVLDRATSARSEIRFNI